MILLVGLGNPGPQYRLTRHNAGFLMLDALAAANQIDWVGQKFQGEFGKGVLQGEQVMFLKPMTYMNLSGKSVSQALNFYKVPPESLIVLHDDVDVPAGAVKARLGGSHGGNNGIRSILECIGTDKFHRIKLGVGKAKNQEMDTKNWVLGVMTDDELDSLKGQMYQEVVLRIGNIIKANRAT